MRNGKRTACALVGVLLLGATSGQAQDWPQWRGPNRDNKVAGFTEPKAWPKELTQKWKVSVGEGLASPALVGDKVYVFAKQGGNEVTLCLNAADGKEVWKDPTPGTDIGGAAARFSVKGPRCAPAVGDGKVCTLGVGGTLSCLNAADGKVAWRKEGKGRPDFYTSSSPLIVDGKCVAFLGGGRMGKGELGAYDLATGEAKWTWTGEKPAYGSPVLMTADGVKQVVVVTEGSLVGVNLADGKLLWKVAFTTGGGRYQTGTPVIDGDLVICGGTAFKVAKEGDAFAAKQVWKGTPPSQYNTPVLKDGMLFGFTGTVQAGGKLYCQDAKTGDVKWTDSATHGECGYVLDAGGVLVAQGSDSQLLVFKPSKEGYMEVAKYKVGDSPTYAEPIIAGNRIFVKDRDNLILWTIE
jgi:outer membrane protein assembly factor BamB